MKRARSSQDLASAAQQCASDSIRLAQQADLMWIVGHLQSSPALIAGVKTHMIHLGCDPSASPEVQPGIVPNLSSSGQAAHPSAKRMRSDQAPSAKAGAKAAEPSDGSIDHSPGSESGKHTMPVAAPHRYQHVANQYQTFGSLPATMLAELLSHAEPMALSPEHLQRLLPPGKRRSKLRGQMLMPILEYITDLQDGTHIPHAVRPWPKMLSYIRELARVKGNRAVAARLTLPPEWGTHGHFKVVFDQDASSWVVGWNAAPQDTTPPWRPLPPLLFRNVSSVEDIKIENNHSFWTAAVTIKSTGAQFWGAQMGTEQKGTPKYAIFGAFLTF